MVLLLSWGRSRFIDRLVLFLSSLGGRRFFPGLLTSTTTTRLLRLECRCDLLHILSFLVPLLNLTGPASFGSKLGAAVVRRRSGRAGWWGWLTLLILLLVLLVVLLVLLVVLLVPLVLLIVVLMDLLLLILLVLRLLVLLFGLEAYLLLCLKRVRCKNNTLSEPARSERDDATKNTRRFAPRFRSLGLRTSCCCGGGPFPLNLTS